ncbi:hypothetical protein WJX73_005631 [Symbiochloris irregularis]|uniref:BZIP domain-containing protein n=1 Tax=Symbiochloris irregularis TaxID=706552 RepID=A0AAW1NWL6_9CHLO
MDSHTSDDSHPNLEGSDAEAPAEAAFARRAADQLQTAATRSSTGDPDLVVEPPVVPPADISAIEPLRARPPKRAAQARAQQRYRERQRAKLAEHDSAVKELARVKDILAQDRAMFAAERAAWAQSLQQGPVPWLPPDPSNLEIAPTDTYEVAIRKTAGMPESILQSLYLLQRAICCVHGWPAPPFEQTRSFVIRDVFVRKQQTVRAISRVVQEYEASGSPASLSHLQAFMSALAVLYRGTGTTSSMPRLTTSNKVANAIRKSFEDAILREHGLPPADHWHKVTDALELTPQQQNTIMVMQQDWQSSMEQATRNATNIPDDVGTFLQIQASLQHPRESTAGEASLQMTMQGESCLARLHQYMRNQSRATTDLVFGIREKVLTPYQQAKLEIASFPWKMDMAAICSVVAERHRPRQHAPPPMDAGALGAAFGGPNWDAPGGFTDSAVGSPPFSGSALMPSPVSTIQLAADAVSHQVPAAPPLPAVSATLPYMTDLAVPVPMGWARASASDTWELDTGCSNFLDSWQHEARTLLPCDG